MEVTTTGAGLGNYPIVVTTRVNDPELPANCLQISNTTVTLVVGESRAQDLPLQPRPNPPPPPQPNPPPQQNNPPQPRPAQIAPIKIAEQLGNVTVKGSLVQTGTDGKAKLPEGPIFLDVNKDTKVWRINLDDLDEGIDDLVAEELKKRPPGLLDIINTALKLAWEDVKFELKTAWRDLDEPVTATIACLFATTPDILNICSDKTTWFLEGGDVHYYGPKSTRVAKVVNSIITRDGIYLPNGTEFVLSLDKNGNNKLTVQEGSVLYIQFSTKQVMLLNATQQLAVQVQQAGGNIVSNRISNVDLRNLDQWWIQGVGAALKPLTVKIQPESHLDPKQGAKTIPIALRANVSGGQPPYAYLWDMGDGIVKEGDWVGYEYAKAGLYTVTLRVRDALGQVFTTQQSVRAEEFAAKPEQPAIATPSGVGGDTVGTILGTLIVFMAVTGAFLRPKRSNRQSPEMPEAKRSRFRPRNMAFLGIFLLIAPGLILLPIYFMELGISQDLLLSTWAVPFAFGFLLLLVAPIKLVIDKARKKP
jgi:PKD repeat protein